MPDFCLPDLGEGLTEAEIIAWRVQVGDQVVTDQIVVEVETAKAAVEVPVPLAGQVAALHAEPGQVLSVGAPLISVTTASAPPDRSGSVLIGYGTPAGSARRRRHPRAGRPSPPAPALPRRTGDSVPVISPLVRKMAREAAVSLSAITGSGPSGLILRGDVERAIRQQRQPATPDGVAPGRVPPPSAAAPAEVRIPLLGLRKTVADKLSRSRREIPEATVWVDVDATELLAARAAMNSRQPERPVSVLALVSRFAILGLRRYPELNGRVEAGEIVLPSAVQLGFAAQTDRGLMVPVVRDAHALSARDLAAAISGLTSAARAGTASPADLSGGTFTVNNYGIFGVDGSAAIINHPEVAILGLGRIIDRPWVVGGAVMVRKLVQLTLAFDHRVCDGGTAGGFLRFVTDCIESPVSALGDL